MGSAVSLECCAGWEAGSVSEGLGTAQGEFVGVRGQHALPWHWCLQAVPEMTKLLKKK